MIESLLQIGISNAIGATLLAMVAAIVALVTRRPPLLHALWLIVLVKFVTPPLYWIDVPMPDVAERRSVDAVNQPSFIPSGRLSQSPRIEFAPAKVQAGGRDGAAYDPPPRHQYQLIQPRGETVESFVTAEIPVTGQVLRQHSIAQRTDVKSPPGSESNGQTPAVVESPIRRIEKSASSRLFVAHWFFVAWLTGSVIWLSAALSRLVCFNRLVQQASDAPDWLVAEVARIAAKLGLSRSPRVRTANVHISPLVWAAWRRPVILLPASLINRLDRRQLLALFSHELAHLRRGDHIVRWLELAVLTLYWWCPIGWLARRQLRQAEEDCCDAWVAWLAPSDRQEYARALLQTVELVSRQVTPMPLTASGLSSANLLQRRIEMILHHCPQRRLSRWGRLAMLATAALLLPLSANLVSQDTNDSLDDVPAPEAKDGEEPRVADHDLFASDDSLVTAAGEYVANADLLVPPIEDSPPPTPQDSKPDPPPNANVVPDLLFMPGPGVAEDRPAVRGNTGPAHAVLVVARIGNDGKSILLAYRVESPIVESIRTPEGATVRKPRFAVQSHAQSILVDKAHVEKIGKGRLSPKEIRSELSEGVNAIVIPEKSELLQYLQLDSLVIITNLDHIPFVTRLGATSAKNNSRSSQFPPQYQPGQPVVPTLLVQENPAPALPALEPSPPDVPVTTQPQLGPGDDLPLADTPPSSLPVSQPMPALAPPEPTSGPDAPPFVDPTDEPPRTMRMPSFAPQTASQMVLKMDAVGHVLVLGQKTPLDRLQQILNAMSFLNTPTDVDKGGKVSRQHSPEVVLQLPESISASHAVKLIHMCEEAGFTKLRLQVNGNQRPRPVSR